MELQTIPERILRLPEVKERTGLSRSMIYLMMRQGRFPNSIRIVGARCVGWLDRDVTSWIEQRVQASRGAVESTLPLDKPAE